MMALSDQLTTYFAPGDVLAYVPTGGMHCRQATAIVAENGRAVDTFWGVERYSDGHVLSAEELETAQFRFRLGDYRKLGEHWENKYDEWMTYAPGDRQCVGSQHQHQSTYYVRVGAEPDLATKIANARDAVEEAERAVQSAQFTLRLRREDLAALESQPDEERDR